MYMQDQERCFGARAHSPCGDEQGVAFCWRNVICVLTLFWGLSGGVFSWQCVRVCLPCMHVELFSNEKQNISHIFFLLVSLNWSELLSTCLQFSYSTLNTAFSHYHTNQHHLPHILSMLHRLLQNHTTSPACYGRACCRQVGLVVSSGTLLSRGVNWGCRQGFFSSAAVPLLTLSGSA